MTREFGTKALGTRAFGTKALALTLAVVLPLLAGCASIKIDADQAGNVDFSSYTSFAVAPPPEVSGELPGYSAIEGNRIQQAIKDSFIARGYELRDRADADLLVAFTVNGEPRKDLWTERSFGGSYAQATTFTTTYIVGTLIVDVYEQADKELVWHGWATKEFFADQAGKGDAVEAARGIVSRFPAR